MKNILVVGINTRPVACSAKKLGYTIYAVDYFCTKDLVRCSDHHRCILTQSPFETCGNYAVRYDPKLLQGYADEMVDDADYILCSSGASPENFPKSKIIGNKNIERVENKYNLHKLLKNKFKVPKTFLVKSYLDAVEISKNYPEKSFILKPVRGNGGKDIRRFEETVEYSDFNEFMLQEVIDGVNTSVSVLSTENEAKSILTSKQIIGDGYLGQTDEFTYCGNVAPYPNDQTMKKLGEEVISELSLVGSNGVDMIKKNGDLYVIEVNPRFQGTLECVETVLGINMVEAHMKACEGLLIDIPRHKRYSAKMVVFAKKRSIVGDLNFMGVYDIPQQNVIIEKDEPLATVVSSGNTFKEAIINGRKLVNKVYENILPYPTDIDQK